jgi:hypothetical protein
MEKSFLKWTMILVIFFIGLSLGVSYQGENKGNRDPLQEDLDEFEEEITKPGNDFEPVNPDGNGSTIQVKDNVFTKIASDGEILLKKGIYLILDKSDDLFRLIFGAK